MAVILGTTPPKPASAGNNVRAHANRPAPIDSRSTPAQLLHKLTTAAAPSVANVAPQPTDVATLRALQANAALRLLAAEVHATGIAGPGVTLDDLARLGAVRLAELKARAGCASEFDGYSINSHAEAEDGSPAEALRAASELKAAFQGASTGAVAALGLQRLVEIRKALDAAIEQTTAQGRTGNAAGNPGDEFADYRINSHFEAGA